MGRIAAPHIITDDSALGGAVIERSLRWDGGINNNAPQLKRTGSSTSSSYTVSMWFKYTGVGRNELNLLFSLGQSNDGNSAFMGIDNNDRFVLYDGAAGGYQFTSTRVYRDPSAWYHFTLSVNSNSYTIYINNESIDTGTIRSLDTSSDGLRIGIQYGNYYPFHGYIADFYLIDGYAYDSSFFGYTDFQTGKWRPKRYEGAYGTSGFHLEFKDNSSTSTLGKDTSGNGNDFTTYNFAVSDSMPDTPTNNFATYDILAESGGSYSEGNLKVVSTADSASSTIGFTSGKFYFEVYVDATNNMYIGVIPIDFGLNPLRGGGWNHGAIAYKFNGDQYSLKAGQSSATASYGSSYTAGDIIGCAVDVDNDTVTFYKNGVSQGNTTNGVSYMSPTGAKDQTYGAIVYCNGGNNIMRANFGQDSTFQGTVSAGGNKDASGMGDFKYAVPSGYNALCSKNLPPNVPYIIRPQKHFDTLLYTGNGSSQTISGLNFAPDWVWIKNRNSSSARSHILTDRIRGATKSLLLPETDAETTQVQDLSAFTSDGFTVGNYERVNENSKNLVAWCWKAGGNSNTFNVDGKGYATAAAAGITDGSIALTGASVNTEAGFSIVEYTSPNSSSDQTVGHGLGKKPDWILVKNLDNSYNWDIYHSSLGYNSSLIFTSARTRSGAFGAEPTSTVYTSKNNYTHVSTNKYVAYCWTEIPGYSKFSSYTGNGNADGLFVYTGFRPAFVLTKMYVGINENWTISDSTRSTHNPVDAFLRPDETTAETSGAAKMDFLSNGFKLRNSDDKTNRNGGKYIYVAFAEQSGITPYDTQTNAR